VTSLTHGVKNVKYRRVDGMKINSIVSDGSEFFELPALPRSKEWSQFPYKNKVGAYCASIENLLNFIDTIMDGNSYLEIGTFDGLSLSVLAEKYPEKEFNAIDLFTEGKDTAGGCLKYFIENNKHLDNVNLFKGTSTEALPLIKDRKFDFVFIDGDHSYEWVKTDIENIYPLVSDGGIISFHDWGFPEVQKAILEYFKCKPTHFGDIVYYGK